MSIMKQSAVRYAWCIAIALIAPCVVSAAGLDQYIGFGDSTLDSGYWRYNSTGDAALDLLTANAVAYGDSGAYNGNGVENSIILAGKFGLTAMAVGAPGGGTNYANGASYSLQAGPYSRSVPVVQQLQNYLTDVGGTANPHALYVIKSGDNDLNYSSPLPPTFLSDAASAVATKAAALQAAGARTIMAPNSYNSAVFAGLGGDIADAAKYAASVSYFSLRWADLQAAGVRFIPADIGSVFGYVVHNPTLFGFTPTSVLAANGPAWNNPPQPPETVYNHALWAHPLTPTQQKTFLFVDDVHLTTAGQTIEADYEYSLLVAPSQVSLVVQSAVQNSFATAATIQRQIDLSWQPCKRTGANFWSTFDTNYLHLKNAHGFPSISAVPFAGTIGVDYRLGRRAILGTAFTVGSQKQKFSKIGGHFNQVVEAPSLYAAYKTEHFWGGAVVTCNAFQSKIKRHVPLGTFTDENIGQPDGYSLALMLGVGSDIKVGKITTGPVASVVLQQAHVRQFTESGNSGVTALSFARQLWNSTVSQLGWRLLGNIDKWQPFAQVRWGHEWGDKNKLVTATLTSVVAPSYTMATAPGASNWADAWLGTAYHFNAQVAMRGAFLATFFNQRVESYGGELGVNVSF